MTTATLKLTELEQKINEFGQYIKNISDNPNVSRHNLEVDTEAKVIKVNCACYTRECTTDKAHGRYNRQTVYRNLTNIFNQHNKKGIHVIELPNIPYPFGGADEHTYNVDLVPEENNAHDPTAMTLILNTANHLYLATQNGYNIGYIPGPMSKFFYDYKKYFTNIKIHTIYNNIENNKSGTTLYNLRLAILYRDTPMYSVKLIPGKGRFASIE